jgi:hypothetical protein
MGGAGVRRGANFGTRRGWDGAASDEDAALPNAVIAKQSNGKNFIVFLANSVT